jgi:hypothetical protein
MPQAIPVPPVNRPVTSDPTANSSAHHLADKEPQSKSSGLAQATEQLRGGSPSTKSLIDWTDRTGNIQGIENYVSTCFVSQASREYIPDTRCYRR